MARRAPRVLLDAAGIAVAHALVCVAARAGGFDHVSDDDFARVTIAQAFAHAPKLDPSGTSWLPFPFWILGAFMAVLGRSLVIAQGVSIAVASAAAAAPYLALRFVDVPRTRALIACAFAFATPWAVWLGASTVPESFTASLTAAGVVALGAGRPGRAWPFALAIMAASLSRYEPWPAAAVVAAALALRAVRSDGPAEDRRWLALAIGLCIAGPLAWMAWNAHAHDGPLHFFRRVSTFKRAIGEGATDTLSALALYPRLLLTTRPEVTITALLLLPGLRDQTTRARWLVPLLCVAAQVGFLAYGNARDGAPAHHPERALLGPLLVLALFVIDVGATKVRDLIGHGKVGLVRLSLAALLAVWATWIARGAEIPGRTTNEDRQPQIQRGARLREEGAPRIVVTPCAFEHFALLAAYGAPENAEVKPRTGEPVSERCPQIEQP